MGRRGAAWNGEEGSILPLILCLGLLALAVILLVANVTSLYLERQRLLALADGASLAASESFTLGGILGGAGPPHPVLHDDAVAATARDYLASVPHGELDGFRILDASTRDGQSASVRLAATWHPTVLGFVAPVDVPITVASSARSVLR